MANCLLIDATNRWICVAAGSDAPDAVLSARIHQNYREASSRLTGMIAEVLAEADFSRPDWIGCAIGPGSFTGIRIGVTTGRSLAQLWDVPVLALESTALYAYGCLENHPQADRLVAMVDGKQQRVYARVLQRENWSKQIQDSPPLDVAPAELLAAYPQYQFFVDEKHSVESYVRDGNSLLALPEQGGAPGRVPPLTAGDWKIIQPPTARQMLEFAQLTGGMEAAGSWERLLPLYLRTDPARAKHPDGLR